MVDLKESFCLQTILLTTLPSKLALITSPFPHNLVSIHVYRGFCNWSTNTTSNPYLYFFLWQFDCLLGFFFSGVWSVCCFPDSDEWLRGTVWWSQWKLSIAQLPSWITFRWIYYWLKPVTNTVEEILVGDACSKEIYCLHFTLTLHIFYFISFKDSIYF